MHHPADLRRLVAGVAAVRDILRSGPMAKYVGAELWPGPQVITTADLTQAVLQAKNTYAHAVGTCTMGDGAPTCCEPTDLPLLLHDVAGVDGKRDAGDVAGRVRAQP